MTDTEDRPDYGPGGYLPDRAARRARKIVLRSEMGLGWPLAAAVTAVLIGLTGLVFVVVVLGPPRAPFVEVAPLTSIDPRGMAVLSAGDTEVVIVRAGGGLRAYLAPEAATDLCAASGRLESVDGDVWALTGQALGSTAASLPPVPVEVHDGAVFVDPTSPRPARPPDASPTEAACG